MKDIYELFNDMDLDLSEFQEVEGDELERARVKKMVREKIARSNSGGLKKRKRSTALAVAAAIVILTAGIGGLGMAFPAYAKEVPVIGDIFRFLNGGRSGVYDLYTKSALDIDMVKADNGIEVTLNQGVYDGKTLSLTYTIKTAEDFGENPHLNSNLDVDFAEGTAGSEGLKKVSPGVYVGQSNYTFFSEKENRDTISFRWSVSGLTNIDEELGEEERKPTACRLNYSVSLKALDYKVLDVAENRDVAQQVAISLKRLSATPINTILYYAEEVPGDLADSVQMVWEIKDDLGNVYAYNENGGQGRISGEMLKMEYVLTFNHLDPQAKILFITPTLKLVHTQGGGVTIAENGEETPLVYKGLPAGIASGEWTMKQVRIDISSLQ
ncbi:DUF4179 domain-containing protein [Desulfosporosinus nitroreducens]|uniref:DUF4179 domain-containing protein n=1 Tax=Desulfosporosinus nitroreducens TaxID=2018668 RepID=A0ABT8QVI4_9FIRM|nr:DUF4179 domain-containing protein [Desulfosporosinus nitroreducens]MDO0823906.1 DUF4179 domain-containing protein [Desulfosporosinus nitroreducens]